MTSVDFSKKALVVITGASRGIGRTLAVETSRNLNPNSIIILLARSKSKLHKTKSLIQDANKSVTVVAHPLDLTTADVNAYESVLSSVDTSNIEIGVIFHNVGSTGELKQTTDLNDFKAWREHYDLNLFGAAILNSVFIKKIRPIVRQLTVVNVTSMAGQIPLKNMAMYGSVKAARDLFFKILALEEADIIVLNYSPGPVDTDMFNGVIQNAQSEEMRNHMKQVKETKILTTGQTVGKLLAVLQKGEFKSGDTVDYFGRF